MEVYYEWIQKLAHGLQILTTDNFLTTVFRAELKSYLIITIATTYESITNSTVQWDGIVLQMFY